MHRFTCLVILVFASSNGQLLPYGVTTAPFGAAAESIKPGVPPATPTYPFGPQGPLNNNPYNNPYNNNNYNNRYYNNNNPYYNNNNPYYNRHVNQNGPNGNVPILSFSNTRDAQGSYAFSFTTGDGKQVQESGYLKDAYIDNAGEPQGIQVVQGSYAYISPDGTPIEVSYVADENGYRPSGVHIPSDGKGAHPFPFPNTPTDKDGKPRFDALHNRYNQFDRYDPYYRNNGGNYFGNRYDASRYHNHYDPSRYQHDGYKFHPESSRYYNDPSRYYNDGYRYNRPSWQNNNYQSFAPLANDKVKVDTKKE